ncbi:hypothetical protein ETAA8_01980 [Anatilimnocola aggregata]|uniref:DUF1552 domain-containing protein n=1 Tax=Anatilimnocola aggregata TaxID=2528021 RepID=A0A517Y4L3_9BACT|nr:DUF1552 domain-containing protein [Anatilimnocola aggregata]QDU25136.1 hypothetical protein ETAA8_01980 [Anatilimnocola aggregata]
MHIKLQRPSLPRRTFLQGAGITLALPWLDIMSRTSSSLTHAGTIAENERPKRSVFCFFGLGINGRDFTPAQTGRDYELTPILKPLAAHKQDFTVISGLKLTHSGGHTGDRTFLTGTNTRSAGAKFRVSCDQELAEAVGRETRFPSLILGIRRGTGFGGNQDQTLSWTSAGTPLPCENRPHILFDQLFRPDTADTIAQREAEFIRRTSVLDSLREEARRLSTTLGSDDQHKLEEYLTGIRDLERRMQDEKEWLRRPKPNVASLDFGKEQGLDPDKAGLEYRRYQRLMFDTIALALQTDSTRVVSYLARMDGQDGTGSYRDMGNPYNYHEMTHHGEDPDKLKWFTQADIWYMEEWSYFLSKLKGIKEGDGSLLDHTLVAYGSSGGAINAHHNHHLPTMLAGGAKLGIKHQGHIVKDDVRLGNLWATMFDRMQVPAPKNFQGGEADGLISELV